MLSFLNAVEAHVLDARRREHRIAMHKVREALSDTQEGQLARRSILFRHVLP